LARVSLCCRRMRAHLRAPSRFGLRFRGPQNPWLRSHGFLWMVLRAHCIGTHTALLAPSGRRLLATGGAMASSPSGTRGGVAPTDPEPRRGEGKSSNHDAGSPPTHPRRKRVGSRWSTGSGRLRRPPPVATLRAPLRGSHDAAIEFHAAQALARKSEQLDSAITMPVSDL